MPDLHFDQVNAIREVFTYIRRFQSKVFLLKIEDSLLEHSYFPLLMKDIVQLHHSGIKIIIVPGTRYTIDKHLKNADEETEFFDGIRLTHEQALPYVKLAAMEVTQAIISHLSANNANGLMGNWIKARSLGVENGIDYKHTGSIDSIKIDLIEELLEDGFIPIVPNIGWNTSGKPYNISSNELTTQLCHKLDIHKVFLIGIEEGIHTQKLNLPEAIDVSEHGIISAMDLEQTEYLLNNNVLDYHSKEYLRTALKACKEGAQRVHLISGLSEGSILQEVFSSRGEGTMVYQNQYLHIRPAFLDDLPEILKLIESQVEQGVLVARSQKEILKKLKDFFVFDVDGTLHGCAALHSHSNCGEIAAVCVDSSAQSSGIGRKLVSRLLKLAQEKKMSKVILLTTQASDWFESMGFELGTPADLPPEKTYDQFRASRVLVKRF
jgi:amino-acid N-acetyltransferase